MRAFPAMKMDKMKIFVAKKPAHHGEVYGGCVPLHPRGDRGGQAEDDAGCVCNDDRPLGFLAEESVDDPQGTVDKGDERLDPVARMPRQVPDDLRDVGHIHADREHRCNRAEDAHFIFYNLLL